MRLLQRHVEFFGAVGAVWSVCGYAVNTGVKPDFACTARIERASGNHAACLLEAHAKLTLSGNVDRYRDHVARCDRMFERTFARAQGQFGQGECPSNDADDFADLIAQATGDITQAAGAQLAGLGPMNDAVKGMNYQPAPSDYTNPPPAIYFDTDFYNQDFVQLWGVGSPPNQPNGRDDVGDLLSLGVNFIRVFNWNLERNHTPWLEQLAQNGIYTAGVFSNGNRDTPAAQKVVNELNGYSAEIKNHIAVWLIGNEISPTDPYTPNTLAVIKNSAQSPLDSIPICVPFQMSSTQDALDKVKTNYQQQFAPANLQNRFIACLNFYGLGLPASQKAPDDQLEQFVDAFFADPFVKQNKIKLLFTEFGINYDASNQIEPNAGADDAKQGTYLSNMLSRAKALQAKYAGFLGQAVFEYTNESWKTPASEANFGLYSLTPQNPPTGKTTRPADPAYPVDTRISRPQKSAVVRNY